MSGESIFWVIFLLIIVSLVYSLLFLFRFRRRVLNKKSDSVVATDTQKSPAEKVYSSEQKHADSVLFGVIVSFVLAFVGAFIGTGIILTLIFNRSNDPGLGGIPVMIFIFIVSFILIFIASLSFYFFARGRSK